MKKHPVIGFAATIGLMLLTLPQSFASVPQKLSQFPEGERLVYERLLDAYHHNQWQELLKQRAMLERGYPTSIYLDNAYYLTGVMEFQQNRLGEALRSFSVVRDRFEKSNKRAGALFAIAMTYNRLKLSPDRKSVV